MKAYLANFSLYSGSMYPFHKTREKTGQEARYHKGPGVNEKGVEYNNRPAKSVNFSGSASLNTDSAKIIEKTLNKLINEQLREYKGIKKPTRWAFKLVDSNFFNEKVLNLVNENEALFENLINIVLAGILKPICVLAMPGAEEEDKQAAATKNIVGAITSFFLSTLILTPVSKGVKKVVANLPRYIKDPDYIRLIDKKEFGDEVVQVLKNGKKVMAGDLADAYSTFYKKVADMAITPTKAAITIAFMPYLLDFLFGKKKAAKKAEREALKNAQAQIKAKQINLSQDEKVFQEIAGKMTQC